MSNLRDRLKRIHDQKNHDTVHKEERNEEKTGSSNKKETALLNQGWEKCGFMVLKREVFVPSPFRKLKGILSKGKSEQYFKIPAALPVLVPDLRERQLLSLEDFLFFDLETTGLSGGAGTVAFLAAFGSEVSGNLQITQYLLLDYPGENDFLENVLSRLNQNNSVIVSYNGKCFDSQIIKTRCLMNRMKPPEYRHADLLHPARRLWKNIIHDCSQASVETRILGLDRSGDIPGALAPEIWFEFLKTERTDRLTGICDHNIADICGLAQMLAYIISIASNPFNEKKIYDIERLALYWRRYLRTIDSLPDEDINITGDKLLRMAADNGSSRALYYYSYDKMINGNYKEALEYVNRALELSEKDSIWREKLLKRKERIIKRINNLVEKK